jgi:hypothetical protein
MIGLFLHLFLYFYRTK